MKYLAFILPHLIVLFPLNAKMAKCLSTTLHHQMLVNKISYKQERPTGLRMKIRGVVGYVKFNIQFLKLLSIFLFKKNDNSPSAPNIYTKKAQQKFLSVRLSFLYTSI